jgi:hypothetical protein
MITPSPHEPPRAEVARQRESTHAARWDHTKVGQDVALKVIEAHTEGIGGLGLRECEARDLAHAASDSDTERGPVLK